MRVNYLVPVYNERDTVKKVVDKLSALPLDKEIIVVDDGSTDGTSEVLSSLNGIRLIRHDKNRGKGAAIITGLKEISEGIVVIQDADLELDPSETPALARAIKDRGRDVVFGTRLKGHRALTMGYICNHLLAAFTNLIFGSSLTDVMTCYKVMDVRILKALKLRSAGFDVEAEITAKLLSSGYRIKEVPVSYRMRTKKEGKKIRLVDGAGVLYALLRSKGKV